MSNPPKVSPPKARPPGVTLPPAPPKANTPPSPNKGTRPSGGSGGGGGGPVSGVKQSLPAINGVGGGIVGKPSPGSAGAVGGGATGGGFSGPAGFSGPGGGPGPGGPGAGGPGSPAAFALGIQRGTVTGNGSGGVSAFAAAVGSLAGCFYALTPFEQQVLTVRTGIDGRRALSRNQVAALLGTSPAAIGTTERNALGELRNAAQTDGCMSVGGAGPANALTAFIGGPFGPVGYVTPAVPPESRAVPGSTAEQQTGLATPAFADKLAMLDNANGQSLLSVLIIALMLSGALAALLLEARRSVH
ncbi:MAG: hypothetical protein M3Z95_06945 [Actinomycetota bacterium]|nr:hypothetical protein [Actinomycetota bacterium]